jgi:hypothetical protein
VGRVRDANIIAWRRTTLNGCRPEWRGANRRLLALALRVARPAVTGLVTPPFGVKPEPRWSQPERGIHAHGLPM